MALNLKRFNRIIDITFTGSRVGYSGSSLSTIKTSRSIMCPRNGIKPNIEINGALYTRSEIMALHIAIKNLYIDLRTEQYTAVKIRAGYENNYVVFEADIFNMYQQSPGPDGTTIIECKYGSITEDWYGATVQLNYEAGTKLSDILEAIKTKLKATDVKIADNANLLYLTAPLQYDGTARGAMSKLGEIFQDDKLLVFMRQSRLCAICMTEGDFVEQHELKYMSAPPKLNPGDEQGNWHTMITAPWMPEVMPGDELTIPTVTYIANSNLVGSAQKKQKMIVTQLHFHFGTTSGANQMTCEGYIVR